MNYKIRRRIFEDVLVIEERVLALVSNGDADG